MRKGLIKRLLINAIGLLILFAIGFVIVGMFFGVFREGAILL